LKLLKTLDALDALGPALGRLGTWDFFGNAERGCGGGCGLWLREEWRVAQGAAEKIKRENDVHLRQLAKKVRTCLLFFIFFLCVFGRFSARGVRKHEKKIECVSKKNHRRNFFLGEFF
jgi:hypothetical protein